VGDVEVYTHPSRQVQRLLKMAATWPDLPEHVHDEPVKVRTARQLRPAEVDELVTAFRAGSTASQLAAEFGIYRTTVGEHLRARGIDTKYFALSPDELRQASEFYEQGWTISKLAAHFDVGGETVRARLTATGIRLRPRGRQPDQDDTSPARCSKNSGAPLRSPAVPDDASGCEG
jgi:hypothetical protein